MKPVSAVLAGITLATTLALWRAPSQGSIQVLYEGERGVVSDVQLMPTREATRVLGYGLSGLVFDSAPDAPERPIDEALLSALRDPRRRLASSSDGSQLGRIVASEPGEVPSERRVGLQRFTSPPGSPWDPGAQLPTVTSVPASSHVVLSRDGSRYAAVVHRGDEIFGHALEIGRVDAAESQPRPARIELPGLRDVQLSDDGSVVAALTDDGVQVHDASGGLIRVVAKPTPLFLLSGDGDLVVSLGRQGLDLARPEKPLGTLPQDGPCLAIHAGSGSWLAVLTPRKLLLVDLRESSLRLLHTRAADEGAEYRSMAVREHDGGRFEIALGWRRIVRVPRDGAAGEARLRVDRLEFGPLPDAGAPHPPSSAAVSDEVASRAWEASSPTVSFPDDDSGVLAWSGDRIFLFRP